MKINLSIQKIFLLDALGAATTAIIILFILKPNQIFIGLPEQILGTLGTIALLFSVYSFGCFFVKTSKTNAAQLLLKIIAIANMIYCGLTISLICIYRFDISMLGTAYFIGEVVVILSLVLVEWMLINSP